MGNICGVEPQYGRIQLPEDERTDVPITHQPSSPDIVTEPNEPSSTIQDDTNEQLQPSDTSIDQTSSQVIDKLLP